MSVSGPDFVALQVTDLQRSAQFYEERLGLRRAESGPPHAVVFATTPIPFAIREPLPGFVPADVRPFVGAGVVLWLECDDVEWLHAELVEAGTLIIAPPTPSPFGPTFTFRDPDGYAVTLHSRS